jgi:hypothetical protein
VSILPGPDDPREDASLDVVFALLVPPTAMIVVSVPFPKSLGWLVAAAGVWVGLWLFAFPYFARVRAHHPICLKCAYDLRGLAEPVTCPECGQVAELCRLSKDCTGPGPRGSS